MSRSVQRIQMIEIDVPSGNTQSKLFFPDQPQLTGIAGLPVIIDAITTYTDETLLASPLTFRPVQTASSIAAAFLTLYQGDLAVVNACPLADLVEISAVQSSQFGFLGTVKANNFRNLINVSWTKCFVQFAVAPSGATKIVFKVCYTVLQSEQEVREYLYNQQY